MKRIGIFMLACVAGVFLSACDDDDDDNNVPENPHAQYTYKCDFIHPMSQAPACKGLVGIDSEAEANDLCDSISIGGASPDPAETTVTEGKCDLESNGYCIGPDGIYTFSVKSPAAEVETPEDDCDPDITMSAAWGCEEAPELGNEEPGTFVCTI